MRVPAVLYAAKSTQDKHKSIPTQLEDGREKAAEEDWEVVGEFTDEGFSAYSGNRGPGLEQAKLLAAKVAEERDGICMLVAQASDRFARGAGDKPGAAQSLVEIWHALRRLNVHLRSVEDDFDLRDSASVANLGHRAMMDSRRKSGAVAKGMKRRREKGLAHGGKRRFGYRFDEGAVLVRIEAERLVVDRMYDEFLAGNSDSAIMRGLIADHIPTALGGRWHQATVRDILMNPLYAGMLRTKDGVVEGVHDPCVSVEKWEKAQELRATRSKVGKGRGRRTSGKHLFRKGMLRCGLCGGSMVPRTTRPGKSRPGRAISETYNCYEHSRDGSLCEMLPVKREAIDSAIYSYFEQIGLDVAATREQLSLARDHKLSEVRAHAAQAETEKSRAEERLTRIRRDYADDKITAKDWSEFREELTAEFQAAEAEVQRLATQVAEIEEWGELHDAERDTLQKLADLRSAIAGEVSDAESIEAVQAALSRLFDHFAIRRVEPGQRVHARLAWQGDFVIEPVAREQAIEGYTSLRPVFVREPIYDGQTNQEWDSSCRPRRPPTVSATPSTRSKRSTLRPT